MALYPPHFEISAHRLGYQRKHFKSVTLDSLKNSISFRINNTVVGLKRCFLDSPATSYAARLSKRAKKRVTAAGIQN